MPKPVELRGQPASVGIASGPLIVFGSEQRQRPSCGDAARERADLDKAFVAAAVDLARLIDKVNGDGAEILAFQLAMLEDDTLKSAAVAEIEKGNAAEVAWQGILDKEISGYEEADNEYFRGRSADLKDLRDRVLRHLRGGAETRLPPGAILAGEEIGPTLFLETDWSRGGGLLLKAGSASSHVAMLARAKGVPMVVGLGNVSLEGHSEAIIDGEAGVAVLSPDTPERERYSCKLGELNKRKAREIDFIHRPAVTADGVRIEVMINVASETDVESIDSATCDGIGLMRTEFLFRDGAPLPDEERQYLAYRKLLEWAGGKPVTIRTLDAGGDKPVGGVTPEREKNPFLGQRGVRLTLARQDIFRPQLRALARSAVHGNLKVMIPMVTAASELAEAARLLDGEVEALLSSGFECARPPLGIMVEVPAVAIAPELFGEAAFFSIGSNDLTQYVTAAARDEPAVAGLNDCGHPAVLRLIEGVVRFGQERMIPVSLCGDMASEPRLVDRLVKLGLRSISVAPPAIGPVKAALSTIRLKS